MQHLFVARRVFYFLAIAAVLAVCAMLHAQNPPAETPASAAAPVAEDEKSKQEPAQSPNAQLPGNNSELSSQDHPATFKVRVNLVLVRVVVRDAQGKVVPDLRKEDFQLLDNRKPQAITAFSVETPESLALKPVPTPAAREEADANADKDTGRGGRCRCGRQIAAAVCGHAVRRLALVDARRRFRTRFGDEIIRGAGASRPGWDFHRLRSGQLPFTADREALSKSLLSIVPRAMLSSQGIHECPDISYYQADLIENGRQPGVVGCRRRAVQCAYGGDERQIAAATAMAQSQAAHAVNVGDQETQYAYRHIEEAMQSLTRMPGQRVMVLVSPGFIPSTLWPETSGMIDRANRSGIVINTIDARGLYTPDLSGDIADPSSGALETQGLKSSYRLAAQSEQGHVLADFANGTGGTFFHNRNDIDEGLREAVAAPPLSYLLGFSPQNMKVDGHFHNLKVTLTNKQKYSRKPETAIIGSSAPPSSGRPAAASGLERP